MRHAFDKKTRVHVHACCIRDAASVTSYDASDRGAAFDARRRRLEHQDRQLRTNDYSKGIILATGYVGQRTSNGLVTCLTDGHPGVSGGGVLDRRGDLVGIPIGRMQGDYRFSFILPMRPEMLRKVPAFNNTERGPVPAEPQ